jgi:hypothetical protein
MNYVQGKVNIVTCIARQRAGKHLATEYAHATIKLRMLLLIARQQSAPVKLLTRNYVTGFLWVRAMTIAMQRLNKRTQQWSDRFLWGPCRGVIMKTIAATEQFSVGDSHGKFVCEEELTV